MQEKHSNTQFGQALWITGLAGVGKTRLALDVQQSLKECQIPIILLDGDSLREVWGMPPAYQREDRLQMSYRLSRLTQLLTQQGHHVVVATISLFHEIHAWNRKNLRHYYEVWLDVPLPTLQTRNHKQLYQRARGIMHNNGPIVGMDILPEFPQIPDWHIQHQFENEVWRSLGTEVVKKWQAKNGSFS